MTDATTANSTAAADTRLHPRYPADSVSGITSVRLSPGGDTVTLVNLSASGILVEGKTRYVPGTRLTVNFEGPAALKPMKSRVVRCQVSAIGEGGALQYQSAIAFDEAIEVPVGQPDGPSQHTPTDTSKPANQPEPGRQPLRNRW
jgi:hypothetical protein